MWSIDKRLKKLKFDAPGTKEKKEERKTKLEINIPKSPLCEIALKSLLTAAEQRPYKKGDLIIAYFYGRARLLLGKKLELSCLRVYGGN
jgi:hypothetical protein